MKIEVKVIPNSSRNEIIEIRDGYLKVKIAAPPEKNKANIELVKFLKSFGISAIFISGMHSRKKFIEVSKEDFERLKSIID